jgi:translocation and assembly module TamB
MADIGLSADLAGTFDNPAGAVRLAIERGRFKQVDLGDSTIDIKLENQQAHVTGLLLAGRRAGDPDKRRAQACPEDAGEAAEIDVPGGGVAEAAADDPDFSGTAPPTPRSGELGLIRLTATIGLAGEMPVSANVTFDKFDYSPFLQPPQKDRLRVKGRRTAPPPKGVTTKPVRGLIDGAVVVNGFLARQRPGQTAEGGAPPTAVDLAVDLRLDELTFQYNRFVLRNQDETGRLAPLIITYRDGRVSAPSFALGGEGVKVLLVNEILRGEEFWVLTGDVDVSVASAFTDALAESSGRLSLRAEIPVAFDLGKVVADLRLPKADFVVKNVPTPVENLNLVVHFADRTATIQTLAADFGGGTLRGGGSYKLPAPEATPAPAEKGAPPKQPHAEINLFVKLKDVKTGFDPYLELALDKVDLFVTDRPDGKLDVSGEIDIARATATYDVDLPTILKALQKPKGAAAGSETYAKREESVFLNIAVRADRGLVFENNLAMIESRADLLITGSNIDLGMIGTVETLKGHALVWNNDYKLTNAMIQFVDETRILPVFDINARTDVKDYKIFVNVSGTPDNFQVTLSSDPPQTEQDIVALLTVGVSYSEAAAGGSGVGGDQVLAVAAQQLLGSQFQNYTGLQLSVDNSRGTPYFKASKEIEEDLTASMLRSIADPTLGAELEYDFLRNLAVYTDWSNFAGQKDPPPSGGFGAGLRLKIEFR